MSNYVESLSLALQKAANPVNASAQKAYMRNKFDFFGLKAGDRRAIQHPFLSKNKLPSKLLLPETIEILWNKPQREFQLIGQELAVKYVKQLAPDDMQIYEYMVLHKSWWDTVDYIAANLMGSYFKKYPEHRLQYVNKWLDSNNIWLQRSALLFQLKYKEQLDTELLKYTIEKLLGSKEFFINKAIGWVLREYGKTDPNWVKTITRNLSLHPLSEREAMRIIKLLNNET